MLTRQGNESVENRVPTDDTITQPVVRYVRGHNQTMPQIFTYELGSVSKSVPIVDEEGPPGAPSRSKNGFLRHRRIQYQEMVRGI